MFTLVLGILLFIGTLALLVQMALAVFGLARSRPHSGKLTRDEYQVMARWYSVRSATHADLPVGPDAPGYDAWYRWLRHEATDLQYNALVEYCQGVLDWEKVQVIHGRKAEAAALVRLAKFDPDDPERAALLSRVEEHLAQRTA